MATHAHPLQSRGSLLSLSDLDKSECSVLDIFRNFLLSHTNNERPHWEMALTLSDNHFGEYYGPQAAISFSPQRPSGCAHEQKKLFSV